MGAGELARAHKVSCFKSLFPIIRRLGGELRRCAHSPLKTQKHLQNRGLAHQKNLGEVRNLAQIWAGLT